MKRAYMVLFAVIAVIICGMIAVRYSLRADEAVTRETRIAVVLNGSTQDRSYSQSYYEAMCAYTETHDADVVFHEDVATDAFLPLVTQRIAEGYWIFICNSYEFEEDILALAGQYPDVYFINGSGTLYADNYTSFLGRIYQARYLSGIVAGKRTATNEIGYVIAEPVPETIRQVNAFTLGVKKVNPEATVYVRFGDGWSDSEKATEAARGLLDDHDIDVLSVHTNTIDPLYEADARGVYIIGNNYDNRDLFPDTYLTACVSQREAFLTERIDECERQKFYGKHYWEHLRTGMVALAPLTGNVYFATGEEVDREKQKILNGTFDVFYGPVYDNYGTLRVREGENLPDAELLYGMYWYVDGVVTE